MTTASPSPETTSALIARLRLAGFSPTSVSAAVANPRRVQRFTTYPSPLLEIDRLAEQLESGVEDRRLGHHPAPARRLAARRHAARRYASDRRRADQVPRHRPCATTIFSCGPLLSIWLTYWPGFVRDVQVLDGQPSPGNWRLRQRRHCLGQQLRRCRRRCPGMGTALYPLSVLRALSLTSACRPSHRSSSAEPVRSVSLAPTSASTPARVRRLTRTHTLVLSY
jgi:hypothetical protein